MEGRTPYTSALVPATFGELGHYRAAAVDSLAARPLRHAGRQECEACHEDVAAARIVGNHRGVACEVCHGPQQAHVADPVSVTPPAPRDRGFCPRCHAYNASRPTGFPQIDPLVHNPLKACINCHDPHAPAPPAVLKFGSVGVPAPNTECKVIDLEAGAPLGPGERGEVCVRGPQIM